MTEGLGPIILRPMKKIALRTVKYLAIFVLLLTLGLGYGAWVIASESLSSERLTPLIEIAVQRLIPDSKAQIGESTIAWDKEKHTITVTCRDVKYMNAAGAVVAIYPTIGLEASVWGVLSGRLLPRKMESDGAAFWFVRGADGSLVLGAPKPDAPPDAPQAVSDGVNVKDLARMIGDELADDYLRHEITITNAMLHVRDLQTAKEWTIGVPLIQLVHSREGANGSVRVDVTQGQTTSNVTLQYRFDQKERFHTVSMAFADIRLPQLVGGNTRVPELAGIDMPLTGEVAIAADEDIDLMRADVHLSAGAGTLTNATLWKAPRPVKSAGLRLHYENSQGLASLSDAFVEFDGPRLTTTGTVQVPVHKRYAWKMPRLGNDYQLAIKLENLPVDSFDAYWPLIALPDAREWIVGSLHKGVFPSGEVTLNGKIDWSNLMESTLDTGTGKLSARGGTVNYMDGMPPVEDVDAEATFDFHAMDVKITAGRTGAIKVLPFTIKMRDLHKDVQLIEIPAHLSGPLRDILRLIDSKPLGYAKQVGIDPEDATGQAEGILTLKLPMLEDVKLEDVNVEAKASVTDAGFKKLIPGIEISQGKLDFSLYSGGFSLKGTTALNKVVGQVDWTSRFAEDPTGQQPLHKAVVKTRMKPEGWAAFGLGEVIETKGETPVTIRYANVRHGQSTLGGEADFGGAALKIASIGLDKPAGVSATVTFDGDLPDGQPYNIKTLNLQGKGLRIKGSAAVDMKTGALLSADLNPFIVGRSNAAVQYTKSSKDGAETVRVSGEAFDMSGLGDKKDEAAAATPKSYMLKLTKLFTSENGFMSSVKIRAMRDKNGWYDMDFWGIAQGTVPVDMKLVPEGKLLKFTLLSDDFGAMMKGMGYSDGISGGQINIWGESTPEDPRRIVGKVRITDFSMNNVPVLARLLSAVSPFGFMDLITGNAHFDNLRGDFAWKGGEIDLSKVRAAGSVVGINIDGRMNIDAGTAKLSGTVVPFSFVNGLIGSIPLLGDVITGGDGQGVIAASYSIDGSLSDPNISVNPVSLLTPGFLRNLFFNNEEAEDKKSPAPSSNTKK